MLEFAGWMTLSFVLGVLFSPVIKHLIDSLLASVKRRNNVD